MLQGFILVITTAAADLNILMNDVIVSVPGGIFQQRSQFEGGKKYRKIALNKSVMMDGSFGLCSGAQA